MKIFCFLAASFLLINTIHSQEKKNYFADQIIVGTGLFYNLNSEGPRYDLVHHELSWINNVSISLTKRIHLGAEYRFIRTAGSSTSFFPPDPTNYFMAGLFTQIDVLETEKFRFFGQLGYDIGNYCKCDPFDDPYIVENRKYGGWGLGINYRIYQHFSLDAQMYYNYVLNRGDYNPNAYGYWAFGVNYDIKRKKG